MAEREYRQLSCRGIGNDCDFLARAETDEKVWRLVTDHLCEVHQVCSFTSDLREKINKSLSSIRCQEQQCSEIPSWGWG